MKIVKDTYSWEKHAGKLVSVIEGSIDRN